MDKRLVLFALLSCFILGISTTHAADWVLLQDDSLIDKSPGPDGLWGTTDDLDLATGTNPNGAATVSLDQNGGSGYFLGTIETNSSGLQVFGPNTLSQNSLTGLYTIPSTVFFAVPFSQTLDGSASNTITINPNNTSSASYVNIQTDSGGTTNYAVSNLGSWVKPSDDPGTLFASFPDLVTHINFLIPLLPAGWTALGVSAEAFVVTETTSPFVSVGFSGISSLVAYSTDPNATAALVPVPAAFPAFLLALGGLWRLGTARARNT